MEVPTASLAGAAGAHAPGAAVGARGTSGPRQGEIAPLLRPLRSNRPPRVGVEATGPGGSWLARALRPPGAVGGVVAPSLRPPQAGERVQTARREALPLARRRRSGDLPRAPSFLQ
jgi:hypothetical protein